MLEVPYRTGGDVAVDPSAAIASGTLLLAEPDCRLTIAPGVCIGAGCIIHVVAGDLTIEAGAIVGSAVLLVGSGKIGAKACIGAGATLVNPSVEVGQVIQQNSFHGSLGLDETWDWGASNGKALDPGLLSNPLAEMSEEAPAVTNSTAKNNGGSPEPSSASSPENSAIASQVYGLEAFYRLMAMLFPHRDFSTQITPPSPMPPAHPNHHQPEGREVP